MFNCHILNIFGGGYFPKTNGSWSSGGVLFEEDQQGVKDDYRADIKFHDDIMCWIWIPRIMVCYNLNNPCITGVNKVHGSYGKC